MTVRITQTTTQLCLAVTTALASNVIAYYRKMRPDKKKYIFAFFDEENDEFYTWLKSYLFSGNDKNRILQNYDRVVYICIFRAKPVT